MSRSETRRDDRCYTLCYTEEWGTPPEEPPVSLFTLLKITRTRYLVGKKQVSPGTPGAVKVTEESRHWYAYRRDGRRQIKVRLFTDKAASLARWRS